jgi:hypothetical protein
MKHRGTNTVLSSPGDFGFFDHRNPALKRWAISRERALTAYLTAERESPENRPTRCHVWKNTNRAASPALAMKLQEKGLKAQDVEILRFS